LFSEFYGSAAESTDFFSAGGLSAGEEGFLGSWTVADPPSSGVPEPASLALLAVGILAIAAVKFKTA
jgi:PEP-CTERM motif